MLPSEQQQSGKLPQALYRLLDPQASVDLPSAHLVSSRQLDNRELDKLFAALGRNKITWRRALVLHEWLLSMGHIPDDRLCTTLIRVCSQHGQTMTALSLYDWMRSSQRAGGAGLVPTVYTYTAAMRAALTGSMIDRAVKVSDEAVATAFVVHCLADWCFYHAPFHPMLLQHWMQKAWSVLEEVRIVTALCASLCWDLNLVACQHEEIP